MVSTFSTSSVSKNSIWDQLELLITSACFLISGAVFPTLSTNPYTLYSLRAVPGYGRSAFPKILALYLQLTC
ncbi:MAG: hypothetical protein PHO46_07860 [Thermoguttaceae bacterium]|nr:hypothetical protein [Thermoguttaceae bacterium]